MPTRKIAITIPETILSKIDHVARKRGVSRSYFISQELSRRIEKISSHELLDKINQVFSDYEIVKEQRKVSEKYLSISPMAEENNW